MTKRISIIMTCLIVASLMAGGIFVSVERKALAVPPPTDPAKAADVATVTSQARTQTVEARLAELLAKIQRLEAAMQQQSGVMSGAMPTNGMPEMASDTKSTQENMAGMSGMGAANPPTDGAQVAMKPVSSMIGMSGDTPPQGGEMGMKMDEMDMDKMDMDKMGKGAMDGGGMPAPTASSGGMMDDDMMEMAGMMGKMGGKGSKGGSGMAMASALPGFPGASHLYHIGATGFFLDHPQHIALSTKQQMMLNQIKEQSALNRASADRSVQQAEQDLWTLTATDQPDNAQIEAKVAEIEKLKGEARLRFISAIGDAAKILNDEQRGSLTGLAPPVSAAAAPVPTSSAP